jgi:hypothetical protein
MPKTTAGAQSRSDKNERIDLTYVLSLDEKVTERQFPIRD